MSCLLPCPSCDRFVKRAESACPFCGASVSEAFAKTPECFELPRTLSRAAMVALFGGVACGSSVPEYGSPIPPQPDSGAGGAGGLPGTGGAPAYGTGGHGVVISQCITRDVQVDGARTPKTCDEYCGVATCSERCDFGGVPGDAVDGGELDASMNPSSKSIGWVGFADFYKCETEHRASKATIYGSCSTPFSPKVWWYRCCCEY
jgi:hypothetical protein